MILKSFTFIVVPMLGLLGEPTDAERASHFTHTQGVCCG